MFCRQSFADKLAEFGCCFDLHGSGYKYREEEARKKVSVLQEELVLLETGKYFLGEHLRLFRQALHLP